MLVIVKGYIKNPIVNFCNEFGKPGSECPTKISVCEIYNGDGDACRIYK